MRISALVLVGLVAGCAHTDASIPVLALPGVRAPHGAVDASGRVHVVGAQDGAVRIASSGDGGRSFETPREIARFPSIAAGMGRGPKIAATARGLCVVAIGGEKSGGASGDVLAWTSSDARTWSASLPLNRVKDSAREGLHAICGDGADRVLCAWLDSRNGRTELWAALSRDGGGQFGKDVLVYARPEGSICECCAPCVAFASDGSAFVMWRNHVGTDRDPWIARLPNGEPARVEGERLAAHGWKLDACPMDGGGVCDTLDGSFVATWRREGEVFRSRAAGVEELLGPGRSPCIADGPGGAWITWLDQPNGALVALAPDAHEPSKVADSAADSALFASPTRGAWALWFAVDGVRCARLDAATQR